MMLVIWAALGVFSQLAFVRLFSTTVGETTYYGNTFFIVAIFSLSCGFFAKKLSRFCFLIPFGILLNYALARWLGTFNLLQQLPGEFQWSSFANAMPKETDFDLQLAVILLATFLAPIMVLIGSMQSTILFQRDYKKTGYVLMAVGGISGGIVFSLVNQMFPSQIALVAIWIAALAAAVLLGTERTLSKTISILAPSLILLIACYSYSTKYRWSPYQKITAINDSADNSINLFSNGFYIQKLHLSPVEELNKKDYWQIEVAPFASLKSGDDVLVLGAGSGTHDVREALFRGAAHVTAVEIDPNFVDLGRQYDPNHSYNDPRVQIQVNDARRFLNTSEDKFNFIYMPFLDSQTLGSNQARFRLDSFLYTKEGLGLAYSKLKDDGVMFVSFATATPWIRQRIYNMLCEATDRDVQAFVLGDAPQTCYAIKKNRAITSLKAPYVNATDFFKRQSPEIVPTDDWPFLYSKTSSIPKEHLRLIYILLLLMAVIFLIGRGYSSPQNDGGHAASAAMRSYAFFSGAAFFFIQIRTISALIPWFGSTYMSQAIVVIAIIFSSLLGTLLANQHRIFQKPVAWSLLFVSILAGLFANSCFHPLVGTLLPSAPLFLTTLLSPTFFAGYLYVCYLDTKSSQAVLDMQWWNLLGGALGGLAETVIILTGFYASIGLILVFYYLAFTATLFQKRKNEASFDRHNGIPVKNHIRVV